MDFVLQAQIKLDSKIFIDIIAKYKKHLLIFDYDGTLVQTNPEINLALLSDDNFFLLNELNSLNQSKTAIVTGRSLANLKKILQGKLNEHWLYYGTHGGEIQNETSCFEHKEILEKLRAQFVNEPHIYIENKTMSLTLHYRSHPNRQDLEKKLSTEAEKLSDLFRVQKGHDVYEFLPKNINKGLAIKDLYSKYPDYFMIFFGDDLTDNYGFRELNKLGGLSVQVGERISEREAGYLINSVDDTYDLIQTFINYKKHVSN